MTTRFRSLLLITALTSMAAGTATAQILPARPGTRVPMGAVARPTPPIPLAVPAGVDPTEVAPPPPPAAAPVVLPPPLWDPRDAADLLSFIQQIGSEGLNPADYDPAGLASALRSADPLTLAQIATDHFNRVSSDLALGHVRPAARVDWHVVDKDLEGARQSELLRSALDQHRIGDALRGLLPTHPQYAALRTALATADRTDTAKINRIRLNMDRWRWLPRDLGPKFIIVNVPGFHATLVEGGVNRWKHRAIAGKLSTPTPQLSAMATGVILNPWWEVPKSIEHEAAGKKGFVPVAGADGKVQRWRQPPGPTNALGQVKFVMPNPYAIYLHDTNARSRFNSSVRALSHGCIRTEHILDLATQLLSDDSGPWTAARITDTLASGKSVQASFVKPLPVYIVYFSSAALLNGQIEDYTDIYGRDPHVLAALLDKAGLGPPLPKPKPATVKPALVATR